MMNTSAALVDTIELTLPLLRDISDQQASCSPASGKWSPKQVIGHLIDSAGNNQQKFIRCMEQDGIVFPNYQQNYWVNAQHYNDELWEQLLLLWEHLNRHLDHLITNIPVELLKHTIIIGNSGTYTLEFIVKDYTEHLKHHLKSIFPEANFLRNTFKMIY